MEMSLMARGGRGTTLTEALGRTHREDPVAPRSGGPAGNARLTAWTGLLLLVLSLAELVTLLDVGTLINWHIAIGTLLIPPALLKTASTGWRVARYYRHDPPYRQAGPPPLLLRILGPGVVASTLGLLASGLLLVILGRQRSRDVFVSALGQRVDWLTLHQAMFIVWAVLTGLHVLARIVPALRLAFVRPADQPSVDGGGRRAAALAIVVVLAGISAAVVLAFGGSWHQGGHGGPAHPALGTHQRH
jgi:hypothetical protein